MTSKQEKLAAARRKLKEFQEKNKDVEISKQKNLSDPLAPKISRDYFHSYDSVIYGSHLMRDIESSKNSLLTTHPYHVTQSVVETITEDNVKGRKMSESPSNGNSLPKLCSEQYHSNENLADEKSVKVQDEKKADCGNGLRADSTESHIIDGKNNFDINISRDCNAIISARNHGKRENSFSSVDTMKGKSVEANEFFDKSHTNKNCLNDVIKPLQMELQNHAQTITILIQQRNDAQTSLAETQQLLNVKIGEAEELKKQISRLTSSTNNLSRKLFDAEDVIMKLKLEKEDNLQTQDKIQVLADNFKVQLDIKEEEFQEAKRKYEEKNNECERLLFSLNEAQRKLSLCEIQLQQYSAEGHSGLAVQVSELQNKNLSLKQKIIELEKKLEVEISEKEESSQKFHIYAQQCSSQLSSLTSELNSLKLENETLTKKLYELESVKKATENSSQSFENEIADLHNQLSALFEKNNQLQSSLQKKKEECTRFENKLYEKDSELNKLLRSMKELEEKNKKLLSELSTPEANERLLATIESDKIAAAKAVSQNQKLKEQVVELEKAFMKLSEEKLELTNQLAHEKHLHGKLENLLKNTELKDYEGEGHKIQCYQKNEKSEPLVNDSNEIGELRNIIRQLQDDKMELKARLCSYESNKSKADEGSEEIQKKKCEHEHEHVHEDEHETQCENTKILLQQMEEKVRKTMNEIAVLDEEKEKLEHLVLQLQGETETIGEYITLYQKQRMLLRQRAQEKDVQLLQLSKDKEELKSKLLALDELVQCLISERENINFQPGLKLSSMNSSEDVIENTAGKIRALINEIGTTTLINNHSIVFEHCSCCSGRLITI